MARKKRQKKSNSTFSAALVFIIVMVLVWALSSCSNFSILDNEDDIVDTVSHVGENEDSNQEEIEEDEVIVEPEEENIQVDNEGNEENPENSENEDIENNDDVGQGASEEDTFNSDLDPSTLSNDTLSWSFKRNENHEPVIGYNQGIALEDYDTYYIVDTEEKVVYLTFDEGYENGYTSRILDTLLANDVQAAFFVTEYYIRKNPELTKRMKEEGHVVGNHSTTHPSFPDLTHEQLIMELEETKNTMVDVTGYELDMFFRPPMGEFSERTLYLTRLEGYKTILWSMAYNDWNVNEQPGAEYALNHVLDNYHPGAIPLLHAVSESNTEALDDMIKAIKAEGYRFGSLYELN